MLASPGYSGTPLPKKLGLKAGQSVAFVDLPADLEMLASAAELGPTDAHDVIHAFYVDEAHMAGALGCLRSAIKHNGALWISWPKKAAKVATDITEDVIRRHALAGGLVDVKVCAVSEVWSGLKLVIPVAQRPR